MKLRFVSKNYFFLSALIFISTIFFHEVSAIPMNRYYDPLPLYSVTGNDFFNVRPENKTHSLDILPFYSHSSGAKNSSGQRVPGGDRLGRWNMIGLLHGNAGLTQDTNSFLTLPNYGTSTQTLTPTLVAAYKAFLSQTDVNGVNFTDTSYTDSTQTFGYFSVPSNIETEGVRINARIPLFYGFVASFKSGFVHYSRSALFLDQTTTTSNSVVSTPSGNSSANVTFVENNLMNPDKLSKIATEIGLSVDPYSKTGLEDSIVELSWSSDFFLNDEHGTHKASLVPTAAIGVSIPTGIKSDPNAAFSVPTGNDGHLGLLLRANMGMDFVSGVGFDIGGDVLLFNKQTKKGSRIPTSWSQQGIYPWKIDVERRPGVSWSIHAGLIARHFSDTLSAYANFIYSSHEKDSIKVSASDSRNSYFIPQKAEQESRFEVKMVNFGLDYQATPELNLGFAAQTPLTGRAILRTTTLMGTLRLLF